MENNMNRTLFELLQDDEYKVLRDAKEFVISTPGAAMICCGESHKWALVQNAIDSAIETEEDEGELRASIEYVGALTDVSMNMQIDVINGKDKDEAKKDRLSELMGMAFKKMMESL